MAAGVQALVQIGQVGAQALAAQVAQHEQRQRARGVEHAAVLHVVELPGPAHQQRQVAELAGQHGRQRAALRQQQRIARLVPQRVPHQAARQRQVGLARPGAPAVAAFLLGHVHAQHARRGVLALARRGVQPHLAGLEQRKHHHVLGRGHVLRAGAHFVGGGALGAEEARLAAQQRPGGVKLLARRQGLHVHPVVCHVAPVIQANGRIDFAGGPMLQHAGGGGGCHGDGL